MSKQGEAPVTTVRLQNIAQSYGQSAALMAAVEIGLFTAISKGAGTYDEAASTVDIHPTNAERLMVMLCGRTTKNPRVGTCAPDVERFLVEGVRYMGPWIRSRSRNGTSETTWRAPSLKALKIMAQSILHGGRRQAVSQRDVFDRYGRRTPLHSPGRSHRAHAHHGYRRRLRRLHRRGQTHPASALVLDLGGLRVALHRREHVSDRVKRNPAIYAPVPVRL